MVPAIATGMNFEVFQLDVQTAFLYADIEEDVYVKRAPEYENTNKTGEPQVMRLLKSLYRLPKSPINWWKIMDSFSGEVGFESLKSDTCVCVYPENGSTAILTLCVDELLLLGEDMAVLENIKKLIGRFKMTGMGDVSLVLGKEVTRECEQGNLSISLDSYTKSILETFGMGECTALSTSGGGAELRWGNRRNSCSTKSTSSVSKRLRVR